MSKSLDNYIGINESPKEIYGKTLSISDALIYDYFSLATDVSGHELAKLKSDMEKRLVNPRDIKRSLARKLVSMYHSASEASAAEEEFDRIFVKKDIPDEIEDFPYAATNGRVGILQLLLDTKLVESKGEARRLIEQGGVSVDGTRIEDINASVQLLQPVIVKVGRRRFLKVVPLKP